MIKTRNKTIIESGKQTEGSRDIEFCGCGTLKNCQVDYLEEFANRKDNNKFSKVFDHKEQFFYHISKRNKDEILSFEVGVGTIQKKKNKCLLVREKSFYCSKDGTNIFPDNSLLIDFTCFDGEFLIIAQYIPSTYIELLYEPNSIIASKESLIPMSVNIEENSILGRLQEHITSIPIQSLLNQIIKYDETTNTVQFFNGQRWIKLVERLDEDPT